MSLAAAIQTYQTTMENLTSSSQTGKAWSDAHAAALSTLLSSLQVLPGSFTAPPSGGPVVGIGLLG